MNASFAIGEVLTCERESNTVQDKYAVSVKNQDQVLVGLIPIELSKTFKRFFC